MTSSELILSVSDFVAVFNQTIDYAYPVVTVQGELANFRVSKNRWVYFDLKDEYSSVKFFGTVYQLSGPLEDGMLMQVSGNPRLHQLYGFSITIQHMQPVGEGSLKRAAALLEAKLSKEGLFDESRKRALPTIPQRVGLITSRESAAYYDFNKILNERWGGVEVLLADVQVQGDIAPSQITAALDYFNTHEDPVDVIVITRGGGSAEDLSAFSTEQVTRAVAASRIPTIVAIGHEVDLSLAELAADQRASTPSNAAQMLVPDRKSELKRLAVCRASLYDTIWQSHQQRVKYHATLVESLDRLVGVTLERHSRELHLQTQLLQVMNPHAILRRGFAIVRTAQGAFVRSAAKAKPGDKLHIQLADGIIQTEVQ